MPLSLADFDYDLPPELIAQFPLPERTASRLLVVDGVRREDRRFADLPELLRAGDLLVFNDTRVLHARLHGVKDSGGRIEVLIERPVGRHEALAQIRASHAPWPGSRLLLEGALEVGVVAREGAFFLLRFPGTEDLVDLLERHGKLPLPPYIQRHSEAADEARYQTVHLPAGAGRMHRERYVIPADTVAALAAARTRGGRVVAVGTTSLRALEAAAQEGEILAGPGETELFILPGFRFRTADALITNFHLPKSTLLMLVSAFGGLENLRRAYAHALAGRYRFFSYGDAMFITRQDPQ